MPWRDFQQWLLWLDAEQVGPAWDRFRHAETLAALLNGPCRRPDGQPFNAGHFMSDPWAPPPAAVSPEKHRELLRAGLEAMADAFDVPG